MGFWLRDKIKTWTNVTSSDTQRLELPTSGIISAIMIKVVAERDDTARTAVTPCVHIADDMDKIEVVESGQGIIKSLDGTVLLAHNLMDFGRPAYQQYTEEAGGTLIDNYFLLFGRFIGDKEYALDLSKHKDVRLEIQHSFSVTDKLGFNTDTVDIEVWIWRYVEPEFAPLGFLKTSEKYHYTASGSAGEEKKELPCLNPYRRILIRTFLTTKTPGECLTDVELVVNDGAYKPFYGVPMQMATQDVALRKLNPFFLGEIYVPASVAALTESHIGYPPWVQMTPKFNAAPENLYFQQADAGRITITETGAAVSLAILRVEGSAYQCVISIPFDIPDIEDSYFVSGDKDKIEIILDHKAVAADTKIVLDELVKY